MTPNETPRKATTGLRRGDAAKIARIHRVTINHVRLVALGERAGRDALVRTIDAYRRRAALASCDAPVAA